MFRRPLVWLVLVLVAAACSAYCLTYFPRAFPLVNLDLRMDRDAAMDEASRLARENSWGPEGFRKAAAFLVDDEVRSFVELEAGGRKAYIEMMGGDLYSPYTWEVRLFLPGEASETRVRFTPAGEFFGFHEVLPEDTPGAALTAEEARTIAERAAIGTWGIDLGAYELVEPRQEVRSGGRIDHTLVYQRPELQVGEGRYRLRLMVSGDRLTEVTHLVKVPEAFERRFQEMRSFNNIIAVASSLVMFVLFLGGGIAGLFFLLRQRWVLWRQPLLWGGIVSLGMALLTINQWPLSWMTYDTALSSGNFLLQRVVLVVAQFFGLGALYVLSFMAAESLTRRAFPGHLQLWKAWTGEVAATPAMLGRTVAGYLLVAVNLAFLVLFYSFAFEKLGWWSPSEALLNPNVLATPFPWLSSIAISLQAGFWEECLFRAVPLAGAALLGTRFGGRRYWIVAALILQALVFGAGHANYPTQPSYARVVELFLPAVFWGVLYLAYGLIPVIVLHVTFDVVLISLPLWVSSAPGLWDDRLLVVLLTLIPLWAVLLARWRQGRWKPLAAEGLNSGWAPPPPPSAAAPVPLAGRQPGLTGTPRNVLRALGAAGAVAWLVLFQIPGDAPPLEVQRSEAIAAADQALGARGLVPPDSFRTLAEVQARQALTHRFVWQEGDAEIYADLLGQYLPAPRWRIRYANFEGEVAARAEEFLVWVDATGQATRVRHQLAEDTAGADLGEEEARAQAVAAAARYVGLEPGKLREVKASPSKEENRTDWHFEFSDDAAFPLEEGEARVAVVLAGDELADTFRYVQLPEQWERNERNSTLLSRVVQLLCLSLSLGVFISGAVYGIIHWSRREFGVRIFVTFLLVLVALRSVLYLMNWPMTAAQFQTALGFNLQAGLFVVTSLLVVVVGSGVVALNLGLVDRWRPPAAGGGGLLSGVALGMVVAGVAATLAWFAPQSEPQWLAYGPAGTMFPWLGAALDPLSSFITTATLMLLVFVGVHRWTAGWTNRRASASVAFLLLGWTFAGRQSVDSLSGWLLMGALLGMGMWAAYVWVLRLDLSLVPPAVATLAVAGSVSRAMGNAYPGAMAGSVLAVVLIVPVALWWHRWLAGNPHAPQTDGA